jgi:hypothetical protein
MPAIFFLGAQGEHLRRCLNNRHCLLARIGQRRRRGHGLFRGGAARRRRHVADDRLPALAHRHVLHRDLLLTSSAVAFNASICIA